MPNELILVVDEEPDIRKLCNRILSNQGYSVYSANSGAHAIRIARETPIDVVLLDLQIPGQSDLTLFETIKGYQPGIVGIVITSYPSMEAAIDALRQGVSDFVPKPFTPAELRQAVASALERRRLERDYARLQALIPLYELSRSLMATTDIDALLQQAVAMAARETGADRVSLMLEQDGKLYIEAAHGLAGDIMDGTETPVGEGIAGWVARHGEPLLLDETVSMPPELADALTREEIASAVCVPLAMQDRVIGVLNLSKMTPTERPFTPSERDLLTVLAGQVAIAIENARLFRRQHTLTHELSQVNANLRALQQAATAITSRLSPERVLQTILDGCAAVMDETTIALGLIDTDAGTIDVYLHNAETQLRETTTIELHPQEAHAIHSQSKAIGVLKEQLSALLTEWIQPASIGVIPLSVRNQLLGAMAVGTQHGITETDITNLTPFADQAAAAIANAQLFTRFQRAHEELLELSRLKSELINATVHVLHSPLSAIKEHTEFLDETTAEYHPRLGLSQLRAAVDELERRIENLSVGMRNLEEADPVLHKAPIAVEEVINSVVGRLSSAAKAKDQNLQIEIPAELPTIRADRRKLEIIIANLMSNAIQFTQSGGTVGIRVQATESELRIAVWDTGPGIPPEQQAQIFDRLHQNDLPTHEYSGAGLGLPIARNLAEQHGGCIKLDSEPGKGSTFTLSLPLG